MIEYLDILVYVLFILAINSLSAPHKAYKGNIMAVVGMAVVVIYSIFEVSLAYRLYAILAFMIGGLVGIGFAYKVNMQHLPQMVALLNGLGGLSALLISLAEINSHNHAILLLLFIIMVGSVTFSGSLSAFFKLSNLVAMFDREILRSISAVIFAVALLSGIYAYSGEFRYVVGFAVLWGIWGGCFILPIGGADMPIIISVLNSLSGWCTVMVGLSLGNLLLIIVGTLVGASGLILAYVMTKAMNRNFLSVLFSPKAIYDDGVNEIKPIHQGTPKDAAFLLENANKVIIVPGYGMAVSGAQFELANMARILKQKYQVEVKYAIHPVAGRMPGHMNVLLAEANVDDNDVFELKDINQEFQTADVAYVIGANDTTNPKAKTDDKSSIYQMPILEVEQAKRVLFVKRSLATGYAGIDNPLFYQDNTIMLLGDAKEITKAIVTDLEQD